MNLFWVPIVVPAAGGLAAFVLPRRVKAVSEALGLVSTAWAFWASLKLFGMRGASWSAPWLRFDGLGLGLSLKVSPAAAFILPFVCLFGFLVALYSVKFRIGSRTRYYAFLQWTVAGSSGVVLANNLLLLLIFWEIVTMMLYLLVSLGRGDAAAEAARKAFVVLGFGDSSLLLGVLLFWAAAGTLSMDVKVHAGSLLTSSAFLLIMLGALAKAGAMPVHSWIPTMAEGAPAPLMALLPASLDKLLGIYLLARVSLDLFSITWGLQVVLMVVGAGTIVLAVMMALIQHNLKKLLSFHAISQVGYMVLGIGTGTVVGVLGGIFHMLNNAIYKSCLFLSGGAAEHRVGTSELEGLGGLARSMPLTFASCLIAAMAISGVPPLNGFVSKWMVYQGVISLRTSLMPFLLVAAMFGSALTLASFIKVLYSVFLGQRPKGVGEVREVGFGMAFPMVVLAALCIFFGIFAQFPLRNFVGPVLGRSFVGIPQDISLGKALWSPSLATLLLGIALLVGSLIYLVGRVTVRRSAPVFMAGERLDPEETRMPGTGFYDTVRELRLLRGPYREGEKGVFDLYGL
ncbi:MAG TPA: hypothetical protein EYP61_08220, partial [Candidatus Latescibacteria bacterium]|nr:hypothetical protein [Candidatus Latescibacterota bacterium]